MDPIEPDERLTFGIAGLLCLAAIVAGYAWWRVAKAVNLYEEGSSERRRDIIIDELRFAAYSTSAVLGLGVAGWLFQAFV